MQAERADAPVIVETNEVLLTNTLPWAEKLGQLPRHAKMPPVAVQGSRNDTIQFERRIKEPQKRAYEWQAFMRLGRMKLQFLRVTENLLRNSPRQVNLQATYFASLGIAIAETRHILFYCYHEI